MEDDRSWMYHPSDTKRKKYVTEEFKVGVEKFLDFACSQGLQFCSSKGAIRCPCVKCTNRHWDWETRDNVRSHLLKNGFVTGYIDWYLHGQTFGETFRKRACPWGDASSSVGVKNKPEAPKNATPEALKNAIPEAPKIAIPEPPKKAIPELPKMVLLEPPKMTLPEPPKKAKVVEVGPYQVTRMRDKTIKFGPNNKGTGEAVPIIEEPSSEVRDETEAPQEPNSEARDEPEPPQKVIVVGAVGLYQKTRMRGKTIESGPGNKGTAEVEPIIEEPNNEARDFYSNLRAVETPLYDGCKDDTLLTWLADSLNGKVIHNMSVSCWNYFLSCSRRLLSPEVQDKFPKDYSSTKKMLKKLGLGFKRFDVCVNNCVLYYKENRNLTVCPVCDEPRYKKKNSKDKDIPQKSMWYLPLTPRLQRLYMSRKTAEHMTWHLKCQQGSEKIVHPAGGEAWKHFDLTHPNFAMEPRNVRLGLCMDRFNPFCGPPVPYSCWPVFATVYNLPPSMCMSQEHIFLTLIIPGPKSPEESIDVLLQPLIDELKELWSFGVQTYDNFRQQNFQMRATLLWTISDFRAYDMLSGWSMHGVCMEGWPAHIAWSILNLSNSSTMKNKVENDPPPHRLSGSETLRRVEQLPNIQFGRPKHKQNVDGFGQSHNWIKKSIFWELPYWHTNLIRHNLDVMYCERNFWDNIQNTTMDNPTRTEDNAKARMDLALYCRRPQLHLQEVEGKLMKPKAIYVLSKEQRKDICEWLKELRFPDGYSSNISQCVKLTDCKLVGMKTLDCHVFMQRLLLIAFRDLLPDMVWDALTEVSNFFRIICAPTPYSGDLETLEAKIVETICKLEMIFPPRFFDSTVHLAIHLPYEAKVGGPIQFLVQVNHLGQNKTLVHCLRKSTRQLNFYVLLNCVEVAGFLDLFDEEIGQNLSPEQLQEKRIKEFVGWFRSVVFSGLYEVDEHIRNLASGPTWCVKTYKGYIVNGFKFHTEECGQGKGMMNSGACVNITTFKGYEQVFYGMLQEVIELEYRGGGQHNTIVLFKCDWYDIRRGVRVHPKHHLVDIDPNSIVKTNEPFVLASQAQQVCYTLYPSKQGERKGWWVACNVKAGNINDLSSIPEDGVPEAQGFYQDDDPPMPQPIQLTLDLTSYEPLQLSDGGLQEVDADDVDGTETSEAIVEEAEDDLDGEEISEEDEDEYEPDSD
ncbi:hypothetical protein SLEP1_g36237 [Rubroshorea leprosula]|uniref:Transposase n=1 Tax=Rubroshorea leprosula TaxID=152421 RepID=A0AAV5KQU1_9ROSI|nr:hypothetical protein SLEP1_g36237 [Rubroshorea leprosula]